MAKDELAEIRAVAEKYPEAERAFLFGDHEVYRVKKKVYLWLGDSETGGVYVSVKLKDTQGMALSLPFVTPASYGMAKWGWIGADFPKGKVPQGLVKQWIDESYRHTAPKKLLKVLDGGAPAAAPAKGKAKPGAAKKKASPAKKRR